MKTTTQLVCVLAALLVTFNSCRKDDSVTYFPDKYNTGSGSTSNTTISGRILDESGQPLQGVNAEIESQIAITDNHGLFTLSNINVSSDRFVVKLTKAGYLDQYFGGKPFADDITFFKATMIAAEGSFTVTSASGGTTSLPDGAIANFPANAFVSSNGAAYSGAVTVKMSYINKDDANFGTKIPGNDLRAIDAGGEDKVLESFGMMNVELNGSSGQSLNLAPGSTAQLSFPIAASQLASAPPTIPIWYFDTESGLWKEDGVATRNGNIYTCSVSHFTWWNCDMPYGIAHVSGFVKSCNGNPVANVGVYANGIVGYTTNSQGYYQGDAPAGFGTFNLQAHAFASSNQTQIEIVPNLSPGQTYAVPDLVFNVGTSTTITGTATDCDNSPASSLVTITNTAGTYWDYIYTNGTFSFTVPQGSTYIITASYGGLTGQITVTAAQAGQCATYSVGLLPVCNLVNPGTSNFSATLITSQFGNQALSYNIDQCSVTDDTSIPNSTISLSSTDIMTNFITNIEVSTGVYQPGNFSWDGVANSLHMIMSMNGDPVDVDVDLSSGGGNTINTAPQPGGMIDVTFSGSVILSGNSIPGGSITGYISGSFNVYRNN